MTQTALRPCAAVAVILCLATPLLALPFEAQVTVLKADGSPVSGGSVALGDYGESVGADGVGTIACLDLAAGEHELWYQDGAGLSALRIVRVPEGQRPVKLTLRLGEEQVVVHGRVTGGRPPVALPRVAVNITTADSMPPPFEPYTVFSSADGTFTLDGKAFEGFYLRALPSTGHLGSPLVRVASPYPVQVDLYCPPEAVVAGDVRDERGNPLPQAIVWAMTTSAGLGARADAQGRFEMQELKPGEYRLTALAEYHVPLGRTVVLQEGQQLTDVTFRLQPTPRIPYRGRVVGPTGAGIAGAEVAFREDLLPQGLDGKKPNMWAGPAPDFTYTARSDEDGNFGLDLPWREDEMHVWYPEVTAEGYLQGRFSVRIDREGTQPGTFHLHHGGRLHGTITGAPEGATVEVQIRAESLPPLVQWASFTTPSAEIDAATGRFDFGPLPPGEHWLMVEQKGNRLFQQQVVVKEGEETNVTIVVPGP